MKILAVAISLLLVQICGAVEDRLVEMTELTGNDLRNAISGAAIDQDFVDNLRRGSFTGAGRVSLRSELLRKSILARVDSPDVFKSFSLMITYIRPNSPIVPDPDWWERVKESRREEPDISLLTSAMRIWLREHPSDAKEWDEAIHREPEALATDEEYFSQGFWPIFEFSLTGVPANFRSAMLPAFYEWCRINGYNEESLEAYSWLCEGTGFDSDVCGRYRAAVWARLGKPGFDEAALVSRLLSMFDAGDGKFISSEQPDAVSAYLDGIERYGSTMNVPMVRQLAGQAAWSGFKRRLDQIAEHLDRPGSP